MVTEDFATAARSVFLTGVAYTDGVTNDNFYTLGEGLGGVTVTADARQRRRDVPDDHLVQRRLQPGACRGHVHRHRIRRRARRNRHLRQRRHRRREREARFHARDLDPFATIIGGMLTVRHHRRRHHHHHQRAASLHDHPQRRHRERRRHRRHLIDVYGYEGDDHIVIGAGVIGAYVDAGEGDDYDQAATGRTRSPPARERTKSSAASATTASTATAGTTKSTAKRAATASTAATATTSWKAVPPRPLLGRKRQQHLLRPGRRRLLLRPQLLRRPTLLGCGRLRHCGRSTAELQPLSRRRENLPPDGCGERPPLQRPVFRPTLAHRLPSAHFSPVVVRLPKDHRVMTSPTHPDAIGRLVAARRSASWPAPSQNRRRDRVRPVGQQRRRRRRGGRDGAEAAGRARLRAPRRSRRPRRRHRAVRRPPARRAARAGARRQPRAAQRGAGLQPPAAGLAATRRRRAAATAHRRAGPGADAVGAVEGAARAAHPHAQARRRAGAGEADRLAHRARLQPAGPGRSPRRLRRPRRDHRRLPPRRLRASPATRSASPSASISSATRSNRSRRFDLDTLGSGEPLESVRADRPQGPARPTRRVDAACSATCPRTRSSSSGRRWRSPSRPRATSTGCRR